MKYKTVASLRVLLVLVMVLSMSLSCKPKEEKQPETITEITDLAGKTVAVLSGSVQDILLSKACPDAVCMRFDKEADSYAAVDKGKADAALASSISWIMAQKEYQGIEKVGDDTEPIPMGFAFNKNQSELREKFNAFLEEYLAQGKLDEAINAWIDPESDRKMPNPSQVDGSNGTLRFATSTICPPFDYIKNGEISGVEAEIMALFAISQNMKWEFVDVVFSGIIPLIQSGKADIGACIMCITPERSESVDFSIQWGAESSILLVRKNLGTAVAGEPTGFGSSIKNSLYKNLVKEDRYKLLLEGLWNTIIISMLAALLGTILGIILCYASTRKNKFVSGATNGFIEFMRCMPQVVFLMLMFYVVFGKSEVNGLWVAVIAFALCFGAYTSVIFRSAVQSIDKGQTEAALSMGFNKLKAFWHVVLPQTVQRALPVYKGEFIGLVKATSIVGYIAVFDLTKAGDVIRSRTYEAFFPLILITIIYFLVIWAMTAILKYVEKKTMPSRKKFYR